MGRFFRKIIIQSLVLCVVFLWLGAVCVLAKEEVHPITLYPRSGGDPYDLKFDFKVEKEGMIKAVLKINELNTQGGMVDYLVALARAKKKYFMVHSQKQESGTTTLRHAVDSFELQEKDAYSVIIRNFSTRRLKGKLTLTYPTKEVKPCDLAISGIRSNGECKVVVGVVNKGPGRVPSRAYTGKKPVLVYLIRNGKRWGGVNLKIFDPGKKLKPKNGSAIYTFNLKVKGTETIRAVVDYGNNLAEAREGNNKFETKVTCKGSDFLKEIR